MILPGEIFIADLGDAGPHPVIVISREELNRGTVILAVVCTTAKYFQRSKLRNCVPFRAGEFGFTAACVAQCENILTLAISQLDLSAGPIGVLDHATFRDLVLAIGYVMDSECEPS
jgi:mRNA-degrading endonuclease toxin of MazEF toxin-antitoxin module